MKRTVLFALLLILGIGLCSNVFAQIDVTIGNGTTANTATNGPTPYGTYWKNFREQYLVLASEIEAQGGGAGNINSLAFNVQAVNNCSPMPNYTIRLKHTTQTALTTTFEVGEYQTVFVQDNFLPVVGWNTHTFSTPFVWNGTSNILVEVVTSIIPGNYTQNASVYYSTPGFYSSLRYQSDSTEASTAPTGTRNLNRSNMRFNMASVVLPPNDLKGVSLTGPITPSVATTANYTVTVYNHGSAAQADYLVKLYRGADIEVGSVAGTLIQPDENLSFSIPWTPAAEGAEVLYGKVVLAGDTNPANDQAPPLSVWVMPAGINIVAIGTGTTSNTASSYPTPYGTYYKNFRQQYLYTAAELLAAGAAPGFITSLGFNVAAVNNCSPMPNYTIRLKSTTQTALTTTFEVGDYTQVWYQNNFVPVEGWNFHTFSTPFLWDGSSNLLVDIVTTLIPGNYTENASVYYTATTGMYTSLHFQNDTVDASTSPTGTATLNRANLRMGMVFGGLAALNGNVFSGGSPVEGVNIAIDGTTYHTLTDALGYYSFPNLLPGDYTVTASQLGYFSQSLPVTLVAEQTTTLNFDLVALPLVTVSGLVVGSDQPSVGLAGVAINLDGVLDYTGSTDALGQFSIPGVLSGQAYAYSFVKTGYQSLSGNITVGAADYDLGTLVMNENVLPPVNVVATEATDFSSVLVNWDAPGTFAGEWIHYDSGEFNTSVGTNSAADFDVAIRYPASALTAYIGTSLQAVKVWPYSAGSFSIRVWTGGSPTAPGSMVIDQPFTPVLDTYNTVLLSSPVYITGTEELWFGYRCNVTSGYPAGCDAGPAVNGFGNMIYFQGGWSTLVDLAPSLDYNWNIQGFVGYAAPTPAPLLPASGFTAKAGQERALQGYKVWRLPLGEETNEAAWTPLTPTPVNALSFTDTAWAPLQPASYKYAVKSAYLNNVYSPAAFSNTLEKGMMGVLTGTVTDFGTGLPLAGAVVTAGTYSGTTDALGVYSFTVHQGSYTISCSKTGYQEYTQADVWLQGSQTTTLNIALYEFTLPVSHLTATESSDQSYVDLTWFAPGTASDSFVDGFEDYPDFALNFAPWTTVDVDGSNTYTMSGATWPNSGTPQAFIIMNPTATTPPATSITAHGGVKMATCVAASTPPNNDWLISPQYMPTVGDEFSFWGKSHVADYGLERFKVGISTTGTNPADFTIISGASYIQVPINWTEYTFSLSAWAGQQIYIAIQCVSYDAWLFFVDDVQIGAPSAKLSFPAVVSLPGSADRSAAPLLQATPRTYVPATTQTVQPNRSLVGYQAWRLAEGSETNEGSWIPLTVAAIPDTHLVDPGWGSLPTGNYRWAVKSAYSGGLLGPVKFSNVLTRTGGTVPVELSSFTAVQTAANYVQLAWITQSETAMLGYRVYRNTTQDESTAIQVTDVLIPATNTSSSHSYGYTDAEVSIGQTYYYWLEGVEFNLSEFYGPVSVALDGNVPPVWPELTTLHSAYPNPFQSSASTNIGVALKENESGTLTIYDIRGQVVRTYSLRQGFNTVNWNGRDSRGSLCGSGVYFYRLSTPSLTQTRKLVLTK